MLGRLLQTATAPFQGPTPRSQMPLESIQEEQHTRDLLFPDLVALRAAQHFGGTIQNTRSLPTPREAGSYDNKGGLDGLSQDDIRIIIAQDTCGRWQSPQVLFDSKKDETKQSPTRDVDPAKKQSLAARGKAMTSSPQTSRRGQTTSNSILSRPTPPSPSTPKSPESRGLFGQPRSSRQPTIDLFADLESRDEKEETTALLNCMFGAAGFRLHSGTKLHVMPRKTPRPGAVGTRPTSSGGASRRRTPLSRSTSLADWDDSLPGGQESRGTSSKPSIMVTRLFTVSLLDHGVGCAHQRPSVSLERRNLDESDAASEINVKQKKIPMYAVSIIIQLTDEAGYRWRADGSFTPTPSPRRGDSYFSLPETRPVPVFDSSLRHHANYILSHWTMLNRNIEILEHTASHALRHLLQAVPIAPRLDPAPVRGTTKSKPSKQQTQQIVYVQPDCLQDDKSVQREVETAAKLVVAALRIRKVVVGQDQWGAWREEARWVGRWAATKDQQSFFNLVLTAFLGNHSVWLRSLPTSIYRRRDSSYQSSNSNDHTSVRYRTVVVASDKMAARRFIFLLSHFFPSTMGHIPLQSSSYLGQSFSENPPSFSLGREKSLRRTINSKPRSSFAGPSGQGGHNRSVSFSVLEHDKDDTEEPIQYSKDRRGSDTRSVSSASFIMPNRTSKPRKASISTILAESDAPVPHFSSLEEQPSRAANSPRPSSGGSVASLSLSQNLRRAESSAGSSGGRWGSVVSGFWSGRRGSSTSDHEAISSVTSSPYKVGTYSGSPQKPSRLDQMVEEATGIPPPKDPRAFSAMQSRTLMGNDVSPHKRRIPRETPEARFSATFQRMPLNINFNEDDGFLDVSLSPGHSFSLQSSLASSFASFRLGTASSCEQHSMMSSLASESSRHKEELTIDAAGWLKSYHPNFTLQAVRPYDRIYDEIKQSMLAEASITPTPTQHDHHHASRWQDICVTLLADTTNFSLHKIRLCRRESSNPQAESIYEEKFFTEAITEIDNTLIDAVERVLAVSSRPSASHSRAASPRPYARSESRGTSRPASIRGRTSTSFPDGRPMAADTPHYETRKAVLGALEDVVRSVAEEDANPMGIREDNSLRDGIRKWLMGVDEF